MCIYMLICVQVFACLPVFISIFFFSEYLCIRTRWTSFPLHERISKTNKRFDQTQKRFGWMQADCQRTAAVPRASLKSTVKKKMKKYDHKVDISGTTLSPIKTYGGLSAKPALQCMLSYPCNLIKVNISIASRSHEVIKQLYSARCIIIIIIIIIILILLSRLQWTLVPSQQH